MTSLRFAVLALLASMLAGCRTAGHTITSTAFVRVMGPPGSLERARLDSTGCVEQARAAVNSSSIPIAIFDRNRPEDERRALVETSVQRIVDRSVSVYRTCMTRRGHRVERVDPSRLGLEADTSSAIRVF